MIETPSTHPYRNVKVRAAGLSRRRLLVGGNDTLFRIHGTTEPFSIGKNASSDCIRMVNQMSLISIAEFQLAGRVIVMAEGV